MNPSKQKGTAWETAVVRYLRDHGFPYANRLPLSGANDVGDIGGVPGVVLECKSVKSITLAEFVDEAEIEAKHAGVSVYAAIIKRRNHRTDDAYVVMPFKVFVELIT